MVSLIAPGSLIDEKYEIVRLHGSGATGSVYEANDVQFNRRVSLKLLHLSVSDEKTTAEFAYETKPFTLIRHENLPLILGTGFWNQTPYIACEWLDAIPLQVFIGDNERLSLQQALPIMQQVAAAMIYAHGRGMIHRSLKPENILLVERFECSSLVKVMDFTPRVCTTMRASSSFSIQQQNKAAQANVATIHYMSPELCQGLKVNTTSDIYSLGCLFYTCLTGRTPFSGEAALAIMMMHMLQPFPRLVGNEKSDQREFTLVKHCCDVIDKCTRKNPGDRYQSCEDLRTDLLDLELLLNHAVQGKESERMELAPLLLRCEFDEGASPQALHKAPIMVSSRIVEDGQQTEPLIDTSTHEALPRFENDSAIVVEESRLPQLEKRQPTWTAPAAAALLIAVALLTASAVVWFLSHQ